MNNQESLTNITGVVRKGKLVCSETGIPITNTSLLYTKFRDIWIEVLKVDGNEKDCIYESDTLLEAINFMEYYEIISNEILFTSICINHNKPRKLVYNDNLIEAITNYLK